MLRLAKWIALFRGFSIPETWEIGCYCWAITVLWVAGSLSFGFWRIWWMFDFVEALVTGGVKGMLGIFCWIKGALGFWLIKVGRKGFYWGCGWGSVCVDKWLWDGITNERKTALDLLTGSCLVGDS